MDMVFVGGIHGVGKSSICRDLSEQLGIAHVSASQLVQPARGTLPGKRTHVDDIDSNQQKLVDSLQAFRGEHDRLILDGHFCLVQENGQTAPVPDWVFELIDPSGLILLTREPSLIQKNLYDRDGEKHSVRFLAEFQDREIARAQEIAFALQIGLFIEPVGARSTRLRKIETIFLEGTTP